MGVLLAFLAARAAARPFTAGERQPADNDVDAFGALMGLALLLLAVVVLAAVGVVWVLAGSARWIWRRL